MLAAACGCCRLLAAGADGGFWLRWLKRNPHRQADLDENKRAVDERLLLLRVVWASPLVPARNDAELSRLLARVEATWRQNIPSRMFDVRHQNAMHLKYVAAPRKQASAQAGVGLHVLPA